MSDPLTDADHDAYWRPLGQLLVERGLLTSEELDAALDEQERTGGRLGEILLRNGLLSRLALLSSLNEQSMGQPGQTGFGSGLRSALAGADPQPREGADDGPEVESGFGSGLRDALARHDEDPATP